MKTAVEWLEDLYYPNYIPKEIFEQAKIIEKEQQDEFAIGFAEWIDSDFYQGDDVNEYHKSILEYREGKIFRVKELLEIYKKEKGL